MKLVMISLKRALTLFRATGMPEPIPLIVAKALPTALYLHKTLELIATKT
jgi:hypothetical protein